MYVFNCELKQAKTIHVTYLRYHIGSASLVIFSFAFIIFFICKRRHSFWNQREIDAAATRTHAGVVCYLHIDEIVEWIDVLLHQTFHLENTLNRYKQWHKKQFYDVRSGEPISRSTRK